jgi:signal transduction histidine kinase
MKHAGHVKVRLIPPGKSRGVEESAKLYSISERNFASFSEVGKLAVFGTGVFLAYELGLRSMRGAPAALWLPDSVLLCGLLLTRFRKWWIYLLLALSVCVFVGLRSGDPLWRVVETFSNDTLQAAFSAYLLRYLAHGTLQLERLSHFASFVLIAVVTAPALSALAGAAVSYLVIHEFWRVWQEWFLSDAMTALVITPMILCWITSNGRAGFQSARRYVEAIAVAGGLLIASYIAFGRVRIDPGQAVAVFYAPVPFLLWAAARFGLTGAATGLSLVGISAMFTAQHGRGPFLADSQSENVMGMQLFLLVISCPLLLISVLFEERRRSESELNNSYQEIRRLSASLLNAHDDERRTVSRELHDEVCQQLTAVLMSLNVLKKQSGVSAGMQSELEVLASGISQLSKRVHGLSQQLHPSMVEYLGLSSALTLLCRESESCHDMEVRFTNCELTAAVSLDSAVCLFTVAQEALRNTLRHSKSKCAFLELTNDEEHVRLHVRDWGCGFDVAAVKRKGGLGIIKMEERVRLLRGVLHITSTAGRGTEVMVEMPLKRVQSLGSSTSPTIFGV